MSIPVLTLIDDNGNSYTFPADFWPDGYSINVNKSIQNFTFAAGGKNTADGFPQARTITISGRLRADNLTDLETKKRAFFIAMKKGGKLQYSDDVVSRYIYVKDPDFDLTPAWRFAENVTITFLAEDTYWVDSAENTVTTTVTGDDTITIDASGSDDVMFPTIEIENDQGVDNPGVKMYNLTDGAGFFEYNDASFLDGDLLIINSKTGEVKKNGNDAYDTFVTPRFLRLQPQSNTIEYEGAACTIRIKYRKVYTL